MHRPRALVVRAPLPLSLLAVLLAPPAAEAQRGPHPHPALRPVPVRLPAESVVVPMRSVGGRSAVDVHVNGKGPFLFYLDTGAQGSVIDSALAREAGVPLGVEAAASSPGGRGIPARVVTLDDVAVGGAALGGVPAVSIARIPGPPGDEAPRGVLSPYVFGGVLLVFDYPGNRIVIRSGELPPADGAEIFEWDRDRPLPEIPVRVGGREILAHVDSGAPDALTLPYGLAGELSLAAPPVEAGRARLVDREIPVMAAVLRGEVRIGRYRVENPELRFVDGFGELGNIGSAILRDFVLTVDPGNARLRFEHPSGDRIRLRWELPRRYGATFDDAAGNPLVVAGVDPGSAAERAGLGTGDRVVGVNGRPVEEMGMSLRIEAFRRSPLRLAVRRGDRDLEVTMSLDGS